MARKPKVDLRLIALADQEQQALAEFERCYTRLKRAFHRMEKARARIVRVKSRARKLTDELRPQLREESHHE